MKNNIKVFIIALILGMAIAVYMNYKYDDLSINALESKVTIFYVGSYKSLEDANKKKSNFTNALIYNDNGIYRVVIGVYKDTATTSLMESYFLDKGYTFKSIKAKINPSFIKEIDNYELLINSSDKSYYESLNNSILNVFNTYIT